MHNAVTPLWTAESGLDRAALRERFLAPSSPSELRRYDLIVEYSRGIVEPHPNRYHVALLLQPIDQLQHPTQPTTIRLHATNGPPTLAFHFDAQLSCGIASERTSRHVPLGDIVLADLQLQDWIFAFSALTCLTAFPDSLTWNCRDWLISAHSLLLGPLGQSVEWSVPRASVEELWRYVEAESNRRFVAKRVPSATPEAQSDLSVLLRAFRASHDKQYADLKAEGTRYRQLLAQWDARFDEMPSGAQAAALERDLEQEKQRLLDIKANIKADQARQASAFYQAECEATSGAATAHLYPQVAIA